MPQTNRIAPLVISDVDPAVIAINTWTPFAIDDVPTDGLEEACFVLRITNRCGSDVFISYNGVDRHEEVLRWSQRVFYFQTNSSPSGYVSLVKKWTKLYIQGLPDGKGGAIYLSGYYNERV